MPKFSMARRAEGRTPYVIQKRIMVSGEDLTDAQPGFDQRSNEPIVTFRFNTRGASPVLLRRRRRTSAVRFDRARQ